LEHLGEVDRTGSKRVPIRSKPENGLRPSDLIQVDGTGADGGVKKKNGKMNYIGFNLLNIEWL
jgi:hypothetical protein